MNSEQLGRTIIRVYLHSKDLPPSGPLTYVGAAVKAGRAMDFAARIRRRKNLDHKSIVEFAHFCNLDSTDLSLLVLPQLRTEGRQAGNQSKHNPPFYRLAKLAKLGG